MLESGHQAIPVSHPAETCSGAAILRPHFRCTRRGKGISNRSDQLREELIGEFQYFFAKTVTEPSVCNSGGARIDMFANRRKSERRVCRSFAKIQFGGSLPRDCTITDISAGGVKVITEHLDVPSDFTIIMSEGRPRQCRMAWRIGYELGAQFVD
jgi:PilZ domain-containing protein